MMAALSIGRATALHRAPVAQLDRVPGYEPGGREFESLRARQKFVLDPISYLVAAGANRRSLVVAGLTTTWSFPRYSQLNRIVEQDHHEIAYPSYEELRDAAQAARFSCYPP